MVLLLAILGDGTLNASKLISIKAILVINISLGLFNGALFSTITTFVAHVTIKQFI